MTCELSQLSLWPSDADELTSSPPVCHASRHRSRGNAKAKRTTAGSGLSSHESSRESDPLGYSLRTSLASELSALTGCCLTWKNSGTPAGRSWWVLTTLARHTDASEFGLWPTATASNPNEGETLESWLGRRERLKQAANNGNGCGTPLAIAAQMWPTPLSGERSQAPKTYKRGNPNLPAVVAVTWPTPTARDHKSIHASEATMNRNARPLSETVGRHDQASDSTNGKPRGSLNFRWVAQLMGAPDGWLDDTTNDA